MDGEMSPWRQEDRPPLLAGPRRRLQGQGTCSSETRRVPLAAGLCRTPQASESTAAGAPPQVRQLWPEKGQPGVP